MPQAFYENSWHDITLNKAYLLSIYLIYKVSWVSRDEILGLFYPEIPEGKARVNLRALLKRIRKMSLCESLESKGNCLRLLINSDAKAFQEAIKEQDWQTAIELYKGDFLKGFYEKSPSLEAWLELERRSLQEAYYLAILEYSSELEKEKKLSQALTLLDSAFRENTLNEELVQAYMRCAYLAGRRQKALEVFECFKKEVENELAISPLIETLILAEKIKHSDGSGRVENQEQNFASSITSFIEELETPTQPFHNFVARQEALTWLKNHWLKIKKGHGQIILIHGEAGTGKTTLINVFCKSVQQDAFIVKGQCSTYMGVGDPYLVFQDVFSNILRALENNTKLLEKLFESGPSLLNTLVPKALEQTLNKLEAKEQKKLKAMLKTGIAITHQSQLFTEALAVLEQLTQKGSLIIILDDLQWADTASLSLLFHLSQRLRNLPLFFITAYRTSAATEGTGLTKLSNEFKRLYGEVTLDLDKVVEQEQEIFVNALLDSEDNQFDNLFRKTLVEKTGGHPLFALELLNSLKAKGQLHLNREGKWVMTAELRSFNLPAKVEAVIEERMHYVSSEMHEMLSLASVEGENFTVELIADLQGEKVWDIVKAFSTLDKKHHLIKFQGFIEIKGKRLSRYKFRHQLFQDYLYKQLSKTEQIFLHGELGNALAKLVPEEYSEFNLQLANHFELAGQIDKSLHHWQAAAKYAEQLAAYLEAVSHIEHALKLLNILPAEQSLPIEISLQLQLGEMYLKIKGWAAPEVEEAFSRAHNLCQSLGHSAEMAPALLGLCTYYQNRADYKNAIEIGDKLIQIVRQNPQVPVLAFAAQGWNYLFKGDFMLAKGFFEEGNHNYNRKELHPEGIGSLSGLAWTLAMMGLEIEAFEYLDEAIFLTEDLNEPFNRAVINTYASFINSFLSKWETAYTHSQMAMTLAQKHCFPVIGAAAQYFGGYSLYWLGSQKESSQKEGLEHMLQGFRLWQVCGSRLAETSYLIALAEIYIDYGNLLESNRMLKEAKEKIAVSGECYYQPEFYRLQGKLLNLNSQSKEAKQAFNKGILLAKEQCSKVLETRLKRDFKNLFAEPE